MIRNKYIAILAFIIAIIIITIIIPKSCNTEQQTVNLDSLNQITQQQETKIKKLVFEIDSLLKLKQSDSILIVIKDKNILQMQQQQGVLLAKIKALPFDSACLYAESNFTDKTKIEKYRLNNEIKACLSEKQLSEVNICFTEKSYLGSLNDTLDAAINILLNTDNLNTAIISRMQKVSNSKDTIIVSKEIQLKEYAVLLTNEKKQSKKQRIYKNVFQGISAVLLGLLALK